MKCTVVLEFETDGSGEQQPKRVELVILHRDSVSPAPGDVNLTLEEGKMLQMTIQQQFATEQIEYLYASRRHCRRYERTRRLHDERRSTVTRNSWGHVAVSAGVQRDATSADYGRSAQPHDGSEPHAQNR